MKDTIKVIIDDKDILNANGVIVADSVLYKKAAFKFPEHWAGGDISAIFTHGNEKPITVRLNMSGPLWVEGDTYYIPHEVIKAPGFEISAFCIKGEQRITATTDFVKVIESGFKEGEAPTDPTPSEYERFISIAKETEKIAQSVHDDAKEGVFNGASAYEIAVKNGYSGTEAEWLNSIKGRDGERGADGKQGETGQQGATGEDGGYYMPSIADGVISFEASKDNMPAVEESDLKEILATKIQLQALENALNDNTYGTNMAYGMAQEALQIAEDAKLIAEGKITGFVFNTEAELDTWLLDEANIGLLHLGDNLYIRDTNVPDYWWDGTSKQPLEAKTDLTDYVKNTDYAMSDGTKAGVVRIKNTYHGLSVMADGTLMVNAASDTEIDSKSNVAKVLNPNDIDRVVKTGITTNTIPLTPEEQAAAQNWLGGQMVKTIEADENGEYKCHLIEMEEGLYYLPVGTVFQYKTNPIATETMKVKSYLIVTTRSESEKNFVLFSGGYSNVRFLNIISYGYESNSYGQFIRFEINRVPNLTYTNVFSGKNTFSGTLQATAELPEGDNSTAIPNTAWVQGELKNVKVDTDTSATPNTIPKRDSNASINVSIAVQDENGENYKGAAAPHTWVNALIKGVNERQLSLNETVKTISGITYQNNRDIDLLNNNTATIQDTIDKNSTNIENLDASLTALTSLVNSKKITFDYQSTFELKPSALYLVRASGKDVIRIHKQDGTEMTDSDGGSLIPSKTIGSYGGSRMMLLFIPENLHGSGYYGCFAIGIPSSYLDTMAKSFYWYPDTDGQIIAKTTDDSDMMIWEIKL